MKRIFTFGVLSLAMSASLMADEYSLTVIDGGARYGGFMPECVSPNGKYAGGSTFIQAMFMSEWQEQDTYVVTDNAFADMGAEIRSITDSGLGVGFDDEGALTFDFVQKKITYLTKIDGVKIRDAVADAVNADGTLITGYVSSNASAAAVYWEDGELKYLPVPSATEAGFVFDGSRAMLVSEDATVIVGYLIDKLATYPMVIWHRQADGSYKCDPVCNQYFGEPGTTKEFLRFNPMSLSPDGRTVLMKVTYNTEEDSNLAHLAYYDIASGNLTVSVNSGEYGVDPTANLFSMLHGLSNGGTSVGYYVYDGGRSSFIMYADDMQPRRLSMEYPLEEFDFFEENGENVVSGISADGRYISGMGTEYSYEFMSYYYVGYVFDRGESDPDTAVGKIESDGGAVSGIYTVDGIKVERPVKGLNIVRSSDGTSRKILIP